MDWKRRGLIIALVIATLCMVVAIGSLVSSGVSVQFRMVPSSPLDPNGPEVRTAAILNMIFWRGGAVLLGLGVIAALVVFTRELLRQRAHDRDQKPRP